MSCLKYNDFIKNILETRGRFGIPPKDFVRGMLKKKER